MTYVKTFYRHQTLAALTKFTTHWYLFNILTMKLNSYITLGRSGLRVSPVCLGSMTFGEDNGSSWGASVATSEAMISRYLELGGNFIDTANIYTKGHSEKIIGDFLSKTGNRDSIVLATKFFCNLFQNDPNGGGAGRKAIIRQCEESLRRLNTDYIDLYYLHNWDRYTPVEETMSAMNDLVQSGKVRYIGFSDSPAWKVTQAQVISHFRGWAPLIALQTEYSLMERTAEGELIPMAQELGLGILPWSPLKRGALSGKYTRLNATGIEGFSGNYKSNFTEKDFDIIDTLSAIASEHQTDVSTIALAYVFAKEGITSTIIGARTLEHLEGNLKALEIQLSAEQIQRLNEVSKPVLNFPADFNNNLSPNFSGAGVTINGRETVRPGNFPGKDETAY